MHIPPMSMIRTVCVYCGSGPGTDPTFLTAAVEFGAILAREDVGLVYGGGSRGLMGAVANAVLDNGGHVTGIIPEFLQNREQTLRRAQEVIVTPDMHVRKQTMFDRADAFVALPGGIGTLEELFEIWTWGQLGLHRKPCGLLDLDGYYAQLLAFLGHAEASGFIGADTMRLLVVERDAERLLAELASRHVPPAPRLLDRAAT